MTTIQDLGRPGLAYYAIPAAGAMDERAVRIAHLLLEQAENCPILECTALAPTLRFDSAATIVLTGADARWTVNGQAVRRNEVLQLPAGTVLKGSAIRDGLRAYLAIAGDWQVARHYDSAATYDKAALGGIAGRALRKGDRLFWEPPVTETIPIFGLYKGPEWAWLSPRSRTQLHQQAFTISPDTNRMGMRLLTSPTIECANYQLATSAPVLPGFVQLPPSGQPIIVLQDGQTTGGYPRIAYLKREDLGRLNQVPLGQEIRFVISPLLGKR
ncbi:MAG: biotin-dependent carboxyltransferase family protein [Bacteroidota bacterium]